MSQTPTTGADAVDAAIEQGIDLDGTPIPAAKLDLYHTVMAKEAGRQGVEFDAIAHCADWGQAFLPG